MQLDTLGRPGRMSAPDTLGGLFEPLRQRRTIQCALIDRFISLQIVFGINMHQHIKDFRTMLPHPPTHHFCNAVPL